MANFENILGKFLFSAMMIISLFSFVIIVQSNNNAVQPVAEDEIFNDSFGEINRQIESSTTEAQEKYGSFNSEEPQTGLGSIVLFGIVSAGKTFSSLVFGFFSAVTKLPLTVLGIPPNVYNLILIWLVILVIISAWLLYKLGG